MSESEPERPEPELNDALSEARRIDDELSSMCAMAVEITERLETEEYDRDDVHGDARLLWQRLDELLERHRTMFTHIENTKRAVEYQQSRIEEDSRYQASPANVQVNAPLALQQTSMSARHATLTWLLTGGQLGGGIEQMEDSDE